MCKDMQRLCIAYGVNIAHAYVFGHKAFNFKPHDTDLNGVLKTTVSFDRHTRYYHHICVLPKWHEFTLNKYE